MILIILIGLLGAYFILNVDNGNNENIIKNNVNHHDKNNISSINESLNLKEEKTNINGLATMIPAKYSNGTIKNSPGIQTYGKYDEDSIYVTVYDDSSDGNEVYQGDIDYFASGIGNKDNNPKQETVTILSNEILYVTQHSDTRGDYRLAFFKVNDKKVLIEWLGTEITPDIKNIIYGFYELN
ncbi:hypothetical protein ALNOE001_09010 [Candidatus Methanobinarius endosymbioticus]|uniref:Uncharacterized protein n=1 Tax=Candidatus Methanobinarius endosymbioticus TaxID=2006182 RepID=A0A366MCZ3_9EURY|nr:hypothetical protein ALNOE001_09010 [Candidatus Methanobinarius endosymbioticus]